MPKKLTTEEFISRARAVHGPQYDYSDVSYVNAETKVCIRCPVHGEFFQIPIMHLYGHGCKLCADENLKKPGMTKEEFISKARVVHGVRFDYSKVLYINSRTEICIVCPNHGDFYQTPNSHLRGRGCIMCRNENIRLTKKDFIEKANLIHNGIYNYEKTNYKGLRKKILIVCPKHGEFYQEPYSHLKGYGCHACGKIKLSQLNKYNTDIFIKKSIKVHGEGKFDYSEVNYKSAEEEVCIICKIHGRFYQKPSKHMKGCGCKKCAIDKQKLSTEDFLSRSNKIHGLGRYDYSKISTIKNNREKVCIICPIHGEFWQTVGQHVRGSGCRYCSYKELSKTRSLSRDEFINRAMEIHSDVYDYSKVNYINSVTKVCIICKIHGEFYQKPGVHLRTRGCPNCHSPIGEKFVSEWLTKKGVKFKPHYSFSDLKGFKNPLRFDFYIPQKKWLIEFDGVQHFRPVRFDGISEEQSLEKFKMTQFYDSLKDQYCSKNSIPLLRIPYYKMKEIPEILGRNLNVQ